MDHKSHDIFEEAIKESLENFEAPFEEADWERMEQSLDALDKSVKASKMWKTTLVAAGVVALLSSSWFFLSDSPDVEVGSPAIAEVITPVTSSPETSDAVETVSTEVEPPTEPTVEITPIDEDAEPVAVRAPMKTNLSPEQKLSAPAPIAMIEELAQPEVCMDAEMHFNARIDRNVDATYTWNFGDGSIKVGPSVTHMYTKPGEYDVVLTSKSRWNQKTATHTEHVKVRKQETPEALFSAKEGNPVVHDNSIQFTMETQGATKYHWSVNDEVQAETPNPKFMFWEKGTYKVELAVYDQHGCESTESQAVRVKYDYNLLAPAAFSPNGDGMDDTWLPVALKYTDMPFSLVIMNSDFKIVHNMSSQNASPWKGKGTKVGEKYVWQATMTDYQGVEKNFFGTISIVK